jgi:hypothetical protein
LATITKYRVLVDKGYAEFADEQEARVFANANGGIVDTLTEDIPDPTAFDLALVIFMKRANVVGRIVAEISATIKAVYADDIDRSLEFTESDEFKNVMAHVACLNFTLAYRRVEEMSGPLMTEELRRDWLDRLKQAFYE